MFLSSPHPLPLPLRSLSPNTPTFPFPLKPARQKSYDHFKQKYQKCKLTKIKSLSSFPSPPKVPANARRDIKNFVGNVKYEIMKKITKNQREETGKEQTKQQKQNNSGNQCTTPKKPQQTLSPEQPYLSQQVQYLKRIYLKKHNKPFPFPSSPLSQQASYLRHDLLS